MNIALINSEYPSQSRLDHGGIATYTYAMANALAENGHTVHVLARVGTVPDPLRTGVWFHTFEHLPTRRLERYLSPFLGGRAAWELGFSRAARRLALNIHASSPLDVVEIPEYGGLAATFRPPLPFPVVIHLHTPTCIVDALNHLPPSRERTLWNRFERKALAGATAFVSPSNIMKEETIAKLGVRGDRISVIRHGISTGLYDSIKAVPKPEGRIDILFSGRLERRKGAEVILASAKQILSLAPGIQLTVAGETMLGESRDYRIAIERGLSDEERTRTWFLGPVGADRLPALYRQSDIFLFPSLFENAPYALLEAMATGLAVIAGNVPGVNEIVTHGKNGLLFDIDNVPQLLESIKEVATDESRRKELGRSAHEHVLSAYAPARAVEQTLSLYQSLKAS